MFMWLTVIIQYWHALVVQLTAVLPSRGFARHSIHDVVWECRRLFANFPTGAYRTYTEEAGRQVRYQRPQVRSAVGFPGAISLQGIRSRRFLGSIDSSMSLSTTADAAHPTALRCLLVHLRPSSYSQLVCTGTSLVTAAAVAGTTQLWPIGSPPVVFLYYIDGFVSSREGGGDYIPSPVFSFTYSYCSGVEGEDGVRYPPPPPVGKVEVGRIRRGMS